MKKRKSIAFEMEQEADITNQLVLVKDRSYIRYIRTIANVRRFAIPMSIKRDLNLQAGDMVYFVKTPEGFYLSFNVLPNAATKNYKFRKLISAGAAETLYTAIPQFITNTLNREINYVHLVQPETWSKHEWQIQFLFSECI